MFRVRNAEPMTFTDSTATGRLIEAGREEKSESQFPAQSPGAEWPDDALIEHTLAGNGASFEFLIARHSRRVFSIARHFFRTHETVEDIVQETFSKAYFSLSSYRRGASFEQWIAKIAVNNCYDELRRRRKRSESLITEISDDEQNWLENKLAGSSFRVHFSDAERDKAAEITRKLLDKLSIEDRMILLLLHGEEYTVRDISAMLGWSEAKVKIRAFRARHAMRKSLSRLNLSEKRKAGSGRP